MGKGGSEGENEGKEMYPRHAMVSPQTEWEAEQCALDQNRFEGVMDRYV